MKATSGRLSNQHIRATATNPDSAQASAGNCMKESFLIGKRSFLPLLSP